MKLFFYFKIFFKFLREREREIERDVAMDDRPEQNLDHC